VFKGLIIHLCHIVTCQKTSRLFRSFNTHESDRNSPQYFSCVVKQFVPKMLFSCTRVVINDCAIWRQTTEHFRSHSIQSAQLL